MEVPDLLRDLPWDLVGPHGVLIWLLAEAEVRPTEYEREGDTEPHAQQSQHGSERNLCQSHDSHVIVM